MSMIFEGMRRLFLIWLLIPALSVHPAEAQTPWYSQDRWQLELSDGSVVFECRLRQRTGDLLLITEADSMRSVPLQKLTGLRLLRPAAKTVAHGARGTFGALAGADDEVYQLTLFTVPERSQVIDTLLRQHPPHS
jgi:hypothetical protein